MIIPYAYIYIRLILVGKNLWISFILYLHKKNIYLIF